MRVAAGTGLEARRAIAQMVCRVDIALKNPSSWNVERRGRWLNVR
jgi:hypothetical protein